ncbi:MAG: hypothetical protein ACRDRO_00955 [Pseudonocardiaceae bacterium]
MPEPPLTGHFRTKDGHEVDVVLELFDGTVAAVEVKAGTRVRVDDLRGLVAVRGYELHRRDRALHRNRRLPAGRQDLRRPDRPTVGGLAGTGWARNRGRLTVT